MLVLFGLSPRCTATLNFLLYRSISYTFIVLKFSEGVQAYNEFTETGYLRADVCHGWTVGGLARWRRMLRGHHVVSWGLRTISKNFLQTQLLNARKYVHSPETQLALPASRWNMVKTRSRATGKMRWYSISFPRGKFTVHRRTLNSDTCDRGRGCTLLTGLDKRSELPLIIDKYQKENNFIMQRYMTLKQPKFLFIYCKNFITIENYEYIQLIYVAINQRI